MSPDEAKRLRKIKNDDLLQRQRDGESTQLYSSQDTFFPPRPIIKKDMDALRQLGFVVVKPKDGE